MLCIQYPVYPPNPNVLYFLCSQPCLRIHVSTFLKHLTSVRGILKLSPLALLYLPGLNCAIFSLLVCCHYEFKKIHIVRTLVEVLLQRPLTALFMQSFLRICYFTAKMKSSCQTLSLYPNNDVIENQELFSSVSGLACKSAVTLF